MLFVSRSLAGKNYQYNLIEEAIRIGQFLRNKCLSYWMDAPREEKINYPKMCKHITALKNDPEFPWVEKLNSMAR